MTSGVDPKTGKSHKFKDYTGMRNGRLVFIKYLGSNSHKQSMWLANCDCGNTTITTTPKVTKSCRCIQKEIISKMAKSKALPPDEKRKSILRNRKNQRLKRKLDPIKNMQARLSRLHRHALSHVNAIKNSATFDELGYSVDDFVKHLERQFLKGMSWDNMSEWQIDHIVPVSTAKTKDDIIALNQLSNLRPLWAKENNRKNARKVFLI